MGHPSAESQTADLFCSNCSTPHNPHFEQEKSFPTRDGCQPRPLCEVLRWRGGASQGSIGQWGRPKQIAQDIPPCWWSQSTHVKPTREQGVDIRMLRLVILVMRAQTAKVSKVISSDGLLLNLNHNLETVCFWSDILCLPSEFKGFAGWVVWPRLLCQQAEEGQGWNCSGLPPCIKQRLGVFQTGRCRCQKCNIIKPRQSSPSRVWKYIIRSSLRRQQLLVNTPELVNSPTFLYYFQYIQYNTILHSMQFNQ